MKLCKDCDHFLTAAAECGLSSYIDPVYGTHKHFFAKSERNASDLGSCGPDGRHFAPITDKAAA